MLKPNSSCTCCLFSSFHIGLVVSTIVLKLWHRKQISKSTQSAQVPEISNLCSAVSADASHINDEILLDEMSAITQQTDRKDITEYQELGEREITNTPDTYETIRAL